MKTEQEAQEQMLKRIGLNLTAQENSADAEVPMRLWFS
jgi:hypothetical protein